MSNYDTLRLEKGLYTTGKSFTDALEKLDPTENYEGTPLGELDAYQRQLKRFDIKVTGPASSAVEKFFATTDSAALFPEYVSRAVKQGMEEANMLPRIVASVPQIDDDKELKLIEEGDEIPETVVRIQENLVKLKKSGRLLVASYEAIRFQKLDLFTVTLKQIGAYIARTQFADAVNVLINGDGNHNAAEFVSVETPSNLEYSDLVEFWNLFSPYELNTLIASPDVITKILNLNEFKDAYAGLNFQGTGRMITPIGADLLKSDAASSRNIVGIDKSCALEMVKAGEVMTEFDKLIDHQLERAAITSIAGFAKIISDATKVLSV